LKEFAPDEAHVLRNGQLGTINASHLVPGDIVILAVGDKVPADCRLLSITSSSFKVIALLILGFIYLITIGFTDLIYIRF
jgi:Ca2+ transporting ATPase